MMGKMARNLLKGILAMAGLSALAAGVVHALALPRPAVWAVWLAAAVSLSGFGALSWAFKKSNVVFFSVFGGGYLLRLVLFGVFAWRVYVMSPAALLAALLTLVAVYGGLLVVETFFLTRLRTL
jgi:hypothetical protein